MPPVLALYLTLAFVFFLFWRERREKSGVGRALWIPLIWLLITGSRFVSQWLNFGANGIGTPDEGSPIDAIVFFSLIMAGLYVLNQRRVNFSEFARHNRWLAILLIFCFVSIAWSDFPFIAFKRWIKIVGHPVMALVVLTEVNPQEAFRRLLKRVAYVSVPFSICFIKYFPQWGRGFDNWTGEGFNCGVSLNKNELGATCMVFGLFFFWNTLQAFKIKNRKTRRNELILSVGFMGLNWYLLSRASSATSLLAMLIGMSVVWVVGLRFVNKRYIAAYAVVGILALVAAEPILGVYATVIKSLGRNLTLTDRTDVWREALKLQTSPIVGVGFESFWLGPRLEKLWSTFWWRPIQAHNGYIEAYLNLGIAGIIILVGQIIGTFRKICQDLLRRFEFARLRLGFLCAIVVYNYTEAAFVGVSFIWTIFFLIAVDYPIVRGSRALYPSESVRTVRGETVVSAEA